MFIVDTLSDEQLEQLLADVLPILHAINDGKVESSRKKDFQKTTTRRDLMFNAGMERFSEDQHSFVLAKLMSEFQHEKKIDENFVFLV